MKAKSHPRDFRKILECISHRHDIRRVFDAFTRFAACALSAQTREPEYLEEAKRWEKQELELFAEAFAALVLEMESKPFEDVIGGYYMEFAISQKGQKWNGEFHTPKHICDLMARITLGTPESFPTEGPITICEPACGAAAMILSLAEACPPEVRRRLRVTAIDINRTACDMAFINTTLLGRSNASDPRQCIVDGVLGRLVQHSLHNALVATCAPNPDARSDGTRRTAEACRSGTHQGCPRPTGVGIRILINSLSHPRGVAFFPAALSRFPFLAANQMPSCFQRELPNQKRPVRAGGRQERELREKRCLSSCDRSNH